MPPQIIDAWLGSNDWSRACRWYFKSVKYFRSRQRLCRHFYVPSSPACGIDLPLHVRVQSYHACCCRLDSVGVSCRWRSTGQCWSVVSVAVDWTVLECRVGGACCCRLDSVGVSCRWRVPERARSGPCGRLAPPPGRRAGRREIPRADSSALLLKRRGAGCPGQLESAPADQKPCAGRRRRSCGRCGGGARCRRRRSCWRPRPGPARCRRRRGSTRATPWRRRRRSIRWWTAYGSDWCESWASPTTSQCWSVPPADLPGQPRRRQWPCAHRALSLSHRLGLHNCASLLDI